MFYGPTFFSFRKLLAPVVRKVYNLDNVFDAGYNPGQKSLGQHCNIHIFLFFLGSLLKQRILFEIFCSYPSPHPIQSWSSEKNSGYTRSKLFVGWGEGLDPCKLKNAPEMLKCPWL